jgi:ubiquinone/menaquinone biosynthesis C-methylase UbiE
LQGARILEIGSGTGASMLPMVEQGAEVVGIDVSGSALTVARDRCRIYGLKAELVQANATELNRVADGRQFDAIIFFAVLEHMTWEERSTSLRAAWEVLRPGQLLIFVETPNRLWHTDGHTSLEPFFCWLPDDIAFQYSRHTRRETYNQTFHEWSEDAKILFHRWGRGVSYHDFVLSLGIPAEKLPVASSLWMYILKRRRLTLLRRLSPGGRYGALLERLAPNVHPGFLRFASLDLALRKQ